MRSRYIISLFIILLGAGLASTAEGPADRVFEEANNYYKNENFQSAINKYSYLIDSLKVTNHVIWYNPGSL
jgi:hypothetical protein